MRPDDICKTCADRGVKITITDLDDLVLVKGTREALEFLAKLLLAQAEASDSGFQISPSGAGRALFTEESTRGLYIARVDDADPR